MKKYLYVTLAVAAAFIAAGFFIAQERRIEQVERTLEEIYLSALYQTREEVDGLALDMEKALLSTDPAQAALLLSSVSSTAENVLQHLAVLPADQQVMLPVLRFAGQLSAYAQELLPRVVTSGSLSPEDAARLTRQLALCSQLSSQLALAQSAEDLSAIVLDSSLLVDTPAAQQARGLPSGEITQQEALDIARAFVGDGRVTAVQAAPGTSGALAAYGVTVQAGDVQLNLEITRQGGKVLWMMPETASFPVTQSIESCRAAAVAFLEAQDFNAMQDVYHQVYDGLCVMTFVPAQEGVLLYPDLVRVQVRMDTGEVVGLEAHSYWLNHVQRSLPAPAIDPAEARAAIEAKASVASARLCLIPYENSERLCYEFSVTHGDDAYLIYIDAQSGAELQLLKTIPLENGTLTA